MNRKMDFLLMAINSGDYNFHLDGTRYPPKMIHMTELIQSTWGGRWDSGERIASGFYNLMNRTMENITNKVFLLSLLQVWE